MPGKLASGYRIFLLAMENQNINTHTHKNPTFPQNGIYLYFFKLIQRAAILDLQFGFFRIDKL